MPVFYFLVVLGLALVWLLFSCLYRPLGRLAHRLWKDARDNMDEKPEATSSTPEEGRRKLNNPTETKETVE